MIDPALDIWVWVSCLVLLALLGARAWVVETGRGRLGRTPVRVRVLSGGVVLAVIGLFGMLAMQGGVLLFDSIVNGTDPAAVYYGNNDAGANAPAPDPAAPADPGAQPPAGPAPAGAPPAGAPPAGGAAAPAAPSG
ncbi:hypothetical protein GCM10009609_23920 [Pseudonocardia aurantiaca]|uniref:Uncharacterized protein n=1 Tax=Pseudonocardia aurantiaca TaxID=75290 RepID=A0ABW4FGZ0_9PSEU